jgi:hypothetical protein
VLAISGVFDLEPLRRTPFLQGDLRLTPAAVRRLSPVGFTPPAGRLFAVVGGAESEEFLRQNRLIREVWGRRAVPVCESIPGANHLDVLDGLSRVPICNAYSDGRETQTEFPADLTALGRFRPVLESMPGWGRPTAGVARISDLPIEARRYIDRLETLTGVPIVVVSTGTARADTLVYRPDSALAWFGTSTLGADDTEV